VDAVVTDRKGEPVAGLQKKDFEILEDGKPQTISVFEEHKVGLRPSCRRCRRTFTPISLRY
jgi:hypothetical protein